MINNKGNTLVEAVLCLALLSMSVIGFYVIIFNIKSINAKKEYEAILYTNILTIFNTCEIDPSNAIIFVMLFWSKIMLIILLLILKC